MFFPLLDGNHQKKKNLEKTESKEGENFLFTLLSGGFLIFFGECDHRFLNLGQSGDNALDIPPLLNAESSLAASNRIHGVEEEVDQFFPSLFFLFVVAISPARP